MADDPAVVDPLMHGLRSKGLKKGSVSLVGAVAIGLAATAPAYSLTGALGTARRRPATSCRSCSSSPSSRCTSWRWPTSTSPTPPRTRARCSPGVRRRSPAHRVDRRLRADAVQHPGRRRGGRDPVQRHRGRCSGWTARRSGSTSLVAATFILLTTWLVARGAEESSRTTLILTIIQYGGLALFAVIMLVDVVPRSAEPDRGVVLLGVVQPVRHPRLQRPAGRLPGGDLHLLGVRRLAGHVGGDHRHAGARPVAAA